MTTTRTRRSFWLRALIPATGLLLVPAFTPVTALADTDLSVGGQAVIAYASGDPVRLRTEPSPSSDIIDTFTEGTTVDVLDGPIGADDGTLWYKVSVGGQTGYIVQDWLASGGSLYQEITGTAWTNDSVTFRSGPSASSASLGTIPAGTELSLTGQTMDNFVSVLYNGTEGFVYSSYLGSQSGSPSEPEQAPAEEPSVDSSGATGTWHTNDSVNLRSGGTSGASVITELPASTNVELTGAVSGGFAQASTGFGDGWISLQYLSEGAATTSQPSQPSQPTEGSTSGVTGQVLVDYAMQYLGYPYVWAGKGPDVFDCSGFTRWVVLNNLGYDIGGGVPGQTSFGTAVEWGQWQPGDLIFFADTGDAGLSHVGIYIGGGQMIHAENPSTGVVISDVNSDYYSSHYAGARRLV